MASISPVAAVVKGTAAAAVGTAAMDAFWFARYRRQGGEQGFLAWEFGGPSDWESVSAPAQVGRRLFEAFTQRPLGARWARLTNNVVHWAYGAGVGAPYGIVAGSARRRRLVRGPILGATVWASSYVLLPVAGLYRPIWRYRLKELAPDLAAHLVYGTATGATFWLLAAVGGGDGRMAHEESTPAAG